MYKKELDSLIEKNSLPKSILLYGECRYFIDLYGKKISLIFGSKEDILSFYFDEYDFKSAKNFVSQASLFGNSNVLIIKTDKKIPKKELDALIEICSKNKNSYFIFQFYGDDLKARDLTKSFLKKQNAGSVRFFKPYTKEAIDILLKRAKELKIDIEKYAIEHLFFLQNEDISLASAELEKISLIKGKIGAKDIDRFVYGLGAISIEDFIEKLLKKEDIKKNLYQILEAGLSDEISIINMLENYITQLFLFHIYIKIHGRIDPKEITGFNMPKFIAQKRAQMSIQIDLKKYKMLLDHLLDTELTLKKATNIDKKSFLISSLIKIQTFL